MKVLIFGGSGRIGSVAAWDLVRDDEVESVGIVGRKAASLERTKSWIGSDKVTSHAIDVLDSKAVKKLMEEYDLGIAALPDRKCSYRTLENAIDSGFDMVDVIEEYHRRPDIEESEGLEVPPDMTPHEYGESLHIRAIENDVTFLDGMGFAPGLSNITIGDGISRVDASDAVARIGGIPARCSASHYPLKYMVTWSFAHVLREYCAKAKVIRDGQVVKVDATSGRERFRFREFGQDEVLEAAITPGMSSLLYTRPQLSSFAKKVIRWPGHWQAVDALKQSGMFGMQPVNFRGVEIKPRDFFLSMIEPRLQPKKEDADVCVMWNTVWGQKDGQRVSIDYYMWAEADIANEISAMVRVTAFSAAAGARLLGRGEIADTGLVPPEDAIFGTLYNRFLEELKDRGIKIFGITRVSPITI